MPLYLPLAVGRRLRCGSAVVPRVSVITAVESDL